MVYVLILPLPFMPGLVAGIEKGHFSVKPCNQCSRRMRMLNKISQGTNHSFREGYFIGHQLVWLLLLLTSVPQAAAARPPRSHHLDWRGQQGRGAGNTLLWLVRAWRYWAVIGPARGRQLPVAGLAVPAPELGRGVLHVRRHHPHHQGPRLRRTLLQRQVSWKYFRPFLQLFVASKNIYCL